MPAQQNIKNSLWANAQQTASSFGYNFSPNCQIPFQDFIKDGVNEIVANGYTNDNYWIAFAQANLSAFTMRMVIEARDRGSHTLDRSTFLSVKELICPIWPFCK
jgi:hypothetical protein